MGTELYLATEDARITVYQFRIPWDKGYYQLLGNWVSSPSSFWGEKYYQLPRFQYCKVSSISNCPVDARMERTSPHESGATILSSIIDPKRNFIVRGIVSETKTAQDKHK